MSRRILMAVCLSALALQAASGDPALRLPDTVRPVRYAVDLKIVPGQDGFSGVIDIEIETRQPTPVIWIHGKSLEFEDVRIQAAGKDLPARVEQHDNDLVALKLEQPIPAGAARLRIVYKGELSRNLTDGLFQQRYEGEWYVFSKFEPVTARRAFPCFDEPSFKTPWKITLHVPKQLRAFSNAPMLSEEAEPGYLKTIRFATSKPLSSYLVALAVGPFDVVDAGKGGTNGIPLRVIVPRGRSSEAAYAASVTPKILSLLENYFGIPYPYEKLDQIVVPVTTAWGAMENAGLIAYSQALLARPRYDTDLRQRARVSTITHEVAHQWFGDLVTPQWWDDLWLNEAFASWLSRKMMDEWRPDWKVQFDRVLSQNTAMTADRLIAARKIRQPIDGPGDIANAFDAITYSKGSAVLAMFDNYAGPATFRKGVQEYLRRYAWKNANTHDFLSALSSAAGRDLSGPFSTFLDQGGVPLVHIGISCRANSPPVIHARQERFLPAGSKGEAAAIWKLPLCMKWSGASKTERQCVLLSQPRQDFALKAGSSCPAWLLANENGTGYYRTIYGKELLSQLLGRGMPALQPYEKVSVLQDVQAMFAAGRIDAGDALRATLRFAGDPAREVVRSTMSIFGFVSEAAPQEWKPNLERLIRSVYGKRAHELGWTPRPGESRDVRLLRASLLSLVALAGNDRELRAEGARLGQAWLDNRSAVDPDLGSTALSAAAWEGGRSLFDRLVIEIKKTKIQRERSLMIGAMRMFQDPEIMHSALQLLFAPELDAREFSILLTPARRETRMAVWSFVKENFDQLNARLPGARGIPYAAVLPLTASGFCDETMLSEVQSFFDKRIAALNGGTRNLAIALESIRLCEARVAATQSGIVAYLKSSPGDTAQ